MSGAAETQFRASSVDTLVDDYYASRYAVVHSTGGLQDAAKAMHVALERGRALESYPVTLELGAGELQHYGHVTHRRERYVASDIREPMAVPLYQQVLAGSGPPDLSFVRADATALPFADRSVDRVVATCLLLHLPDPLHALREWQRVCRPTGVIDLLVPCEPGLALRVFRTLVSRRVARAQGVSGADFDLVNALDHVNYFGRVLAITRASLNPGCRLQVRYYPFRVLPAWNLNAFAIFSITPDGTPHGT